MKVTAMRAWAPVVGFSLVLLGCGEKIAEPTPEPKVPQSAAAAVPDPTELVKEDVTVGTGDRAVKDGDAIKVNYVGRLLKTGAKFDSNTDKAKPFPFTVGEGVIDGWSQGVIGMKRGGKRKLTIPSKLAYGPAGKPPKIPGDAPLVFEIDLIGWADDPAPAASGSAAAGSAAPSAGPPAASAGPAAGSGSPKGAPPAPPKDTKPE